MTIVGEIYDGGLTDFLDLVSEISGDSDIKFFETLAQEYPGIIVELGVGVGRVARRVKPTYGIDLAISAIQRCQEKMGADSPQILQEDFLNYTLPDLADLTYLPAGTINNIKPSDRLTLLKNVFDNTAPGGHFVFDALVPNPDDYCKRSNFPMFRARTNEWVLFELISLVSLAAQELKVHYHADYLDNQGNVIKRRYFPQHSVYYAYPEEYEVDILESGWKIRSVWGNYDRSIMTRRSDYQIWLLEKSL